MDVKYLSFVLAHYFCVAVLLKFLCCITPSFVAHLFITLVSVFVYLALAGITFNSAKRKWLNENVPANGKAVLITGCDSGFGNVLAQRLDAKGFHVFASCLSLSSPGISDLEKNCSDRIRFLQLDVTKDYSVRGAVEYVEKNLGSSELWAIVNNAGVLKGFSIELTDVEEFVECMDVNAFGALRTTKAFLPMLRKSKGRVVNQISLGGRCAMPHFTPYTMSKFAAVAFSECLRQEIRDWGIRVISVEPESYKTSMTHPLTIDGRIDSTFESLDEEMKSTYGEEYLKCFKEFAIHNLSLASPNLHVVADALESAVCLKYPDSVYTPCRDSITSVAVFIYKLLPIIVTDFAVRLVMWLLKFPAVKKIKC